MTMTIAELRARVAARFPDVEQVSESTIRFTRKAGESPFAVYYLALAQDLPSTQEMLTKYQDQVIGERYFEGRKSLQWSTYLYFVTSGDRLASSEVQLAKDLIEHDRSYARKFIISEEEIDSVLTPTVVTPTAGTPNASILSVWTDRLVEAGLDKAILTDDDLPSRLRLIEASTGPGPQRSARKRATKVKSATFLRSLELTKFRPFPSQRVFAFGTVNLIFGPNGSGKTSLLEAIELFYCGRNKRNPSTTAPYELTAMLADGVVERAHHQRGLQVFRDRNLTWYGQPEVKSNYLYLSFAQFNFLDTDAAVNLAGDKQSAPRIEEDLSSLLVGPDASKTWRDIERVHEAVRLKARDLRLLRQQVQEELTALERRIKLVSAIPKESDTIRSRLLEMIRRIGWSGSHTGEAAFSGQLAEALAELGAVVQQVLDIGWTESPVSMNGLDNYCHETGVTCEQARQGMERLGLLSRDERSLLAAGERAQEARDLLELVLRFIDAGVPQRISERDEHERAVATYSDWLAGMDEEVLRSLSTESSEMRVVDYRDGAVSHRSAAEGLLANARTDYASFSRLRDQALILAQELRQIAGRILEDSPNRDECPLCHTQFEAGGLARHITLSADEHLEAVGQALLSQIRVTEEEVLRARGIETAATWLRGFCERAQVRADMSIGSALAEIESAKGALVESRSRLEEINREQLTLESEGLTRARLDETVGRLRDMGYALDGASGPNTDELREMIQRDVAAAVLSLEAVRGAASEQRAALGSVLGAGTLGDHALSGLLSQLKERLATTEALRMKLAGLLAVFPWPEDRPLAELAVEADSIRNIASELQTALGREGQTQTAYAEATQRKDHLETQLLGLRSRLKRLTDAESTLGRLRKEDSLTSAMEAALRQNRAAIEMIFSRIHSPSEFRGLGANWTTLVRKVDGHDAQLSEISTGQRAAFALSIFLAQNAQLRVAPPVVLIDDPIAHVDDLNALSFLDYLREIAIAGGRQIYFATANDKLATLFERKFDFLGADGFRRIDLKREAPVT